MCKNDLMVFDNNEFMVEAKQNNGNLEFKLDGIAKSLGFTTVATSGNETIRWSRINGYLEDLGLNQKFKSGDFIPEQYCYLLAMKAKNDIAVAFQKWLAFEVIPSLRKHGAYISEDADVDYVHNELRFSQKRTIKTFANANVSDIKQLYSDFRQYVDCEYKYKTDDRLARYKSVEKGLENLHNRIAIEDIGNIGDCYNIRKLKEQVIIDRTTLEKRISGGVKTSQTKKIKELQDELSNVYPDSDEFITIDYHGISNNYQYVTNEEGTFKTETYKKWLRYFPIEQLPEIDFWGIDFTKPVEMFIEYVCKDSIDHHNMNKATIDLICHELGVDDNIIHKTHSDKIGNCDNYNDGKIRFYIREIG